MSQVRSEGNGTGTSFLDTFLHRGSVPTVAAFEMAQMGKPRLRG